MKLTPLSMQDSYRLHVSTMTQAEWVLVRNNQARSSNTHGNNYLRA